MVIDLVCDDAGMPIGFAKITRDITRQKADAERIAKVSRTLEAALSNMKHGLCVFDGSGSLQLANRRFLDMFGLERATALEGLPFESIVRDVLFGTGTSTTDAGHFFHRHMEGIGTASEQSVVEDLPSGMPVAISHAGMPGGGWVSTFEDITERKRADQDSLTGLANRRAFRSRLDGLAALDRRGAVGRHAARPRRFQIRQRHLRACGGRYGAQARRRYLARRAPHRRSCGPPGGR